MPWAVRTMPVPVATAAGLHLVDAEHLERGARADDVDDGVDAADLVEVDLVGRAPVEAALDLGQRGEGGLRRGRGPGRAGGPPR